MVARGHISSKQVFLCKSKKSITHFCCTSHGVNTTLGTFYHSSLTWLIMIVIELHFDIFVTVRTLSGRFSRIIQCSHSHHLDTESVEWDTLRQSCVSSRLSVVLAMGTWVLLQSDYLGSGSPLILQYVAAAHDCMVMKGVFTHDDNSYPDCWLMINYLCCVVWTD